jgi:putative membrane protein
MFTLLARWVLNALALFIVSRIVPGIRLEDFTSALVAVIVIALINALLKPILLILTLPITILSLGLFTFVLNALLLLLAGSITPGLKVDGFGAALIGSVLLSVISTILHSLAR